MIEKKCPGCKETGKLESFTKIKPKLLIKPPIYICPYCGAKIRNNIFADILHLIAFFTLMKILFFSGVELTTEYVVTWVLAYIIIVIMISYLLPDFISAKFKKEEYYNVEDIESAQDKKSILPPSNAPEIRVEFKDGDNVIILINSISGVESVYVNGELKHKKRCLSRKSNIAFEHDSNEYLFEIKIKSWLSGTVNIRLIKNKTLIGTARAIAKNAFIINMVSILMVVSIIVLVYFDKYLEIVGVLFFYFLFNLIVKLKIVVSVFTPEESDKR